jgi:hypothetical protein
MVKYWKFLKEGIFSTGLYVDKYGKRNGQKRHLYNLCKIFQCEIFVKMGSLLTVLGRDRNIMNSVLLEGKP